MNPEAIPRYTARRQLWSALVLEAIPSLSAPRAPRGTRHVSRWPHKDSLGN